MSYLSRLRDAFTAAPTEDARAAIVDLIERAPTADLGDVRVKLLAYLWCRGGLSAGATADQRIIDGIIRDLGTDDAQGC